MINKKAQEEMIGFVMIILLVTVIFLVFLGIYLRQGSSNESTQNAEVAQFLDALTEITTDCEINGLKRTVKYLLREDQGLPCEDTTMTVHEVLDKTIRNAIESGWNFDVDSPTKGYDFISENVNPSSNNCANIPSVSAQKAIDEDTTIELRICKYD